MEDALSLKEILVVIRRRFLIITAIVLVCTGTAALLSYVLLPSVYTAQASLIVSERQTSQTAGVLDYSQVQTYRTLAVTYAEIITSRTIFQDAINKLKLKTTVENLAKATTAQVRGQTEIINLSVRDADAKRAALIANTLAASFINQLPKLVSRVEKVSIIDPAAVPVKKTSPRPLLLLAIGMVGGLVLGFLAAFLVDYLDDTVKTADDVRQLLGLRVLAVVPDVHLHERRAP